MSATATPPTRVGTPRKIGELETRLRERADKAPATARCAVDGCGFVHKGTAIECREAARVHRVEKHPELPEHPTQPVKSRRLRWTPEQAIEAVQAYARTHGRPPISSDSGFPRGSALIRLFGTWANMIEAAGFDRPVRGRRPAPLADAQSSPKAPDAPIAAQASPEPAQGLRSPDSASLPPAVGDGPEPGHPVTAAREDAPVEAGDGDTPAAPAGPDTASPLGLLAAGIEDAIGPQEPATVRLLGKALLLGFVVGRDFQRIHADHDHLRWLARTIFAD